MLRKFALLVAAAAALTVLLSSSASAFTFGTPQTRVAGLDDEEMSSIATADVDGDGLLDAVAAGFNPGAPGGASVIAVLPGRANGTLGPARNYPVLANVAVNGIGIGDFNEDGYPDVVTGMVFNEEIAVLLNDGDGGFAAATPYSAGGFSPQGFVVADFDGDEHLDIASLNGADSYTVFTGQGDGTFEAGTAEPVGDWVMGFAGADFNGDDEIDLAVGNTGDSTITVLLGEGDGTFTEAPEIDLTELLPPEEECGCVEPWDIATGDVNGDGRPDMVFADRFENRIGTVINELDGSFEPLGLYPTSNGGNPISVAVGDLDADGDLDAVTADYLEEATTVLAGDGAGAFTTALEMSAGPIPSDNTIADIDRDGRLDLLYADQGWDTGEVTLVRNLGKPTISLGPGTIDFGSQAQQTLSAPRAVTVTNAGDALLNVKGIVAGGESAGDFLVDAGDCTSAPVPAGQSCTALVRFSPSAAGAREATVVVFSDVPTMPAVVVAGTGTSLPAGPAGPVGPPGPAGKEGASAKLVLALAQKKSTAVAGKRIQLSFAATLPGKATLTVKGGPTVKKTLKAAGTGTLGLKLGKPGTYRLKLAFAATDGQRRSATGKVVVSAP